MEAIISEDRPNLILDRTMDFSIRIVNTYKYLCSEKKEYTLSKQLLRAGTSIGANTHEAIRGQSTKDFLAKLYIALKEANETEYWLKLLLKTEFFTPKQGESLLSDCDELIRILHSIIISTKKNNPDL